MKTLAQLIRTPSVARTLPALDRFPCLFGSARCLRRGAISLLAAAALAVPSTAIAQVTSSLAATEHPIAMPASFELLPRLGNDGVSDLVVFVRSEGLAGDGTSNNNIWYQRLDASGAPAGAAVQVSAGTDECAISDVSGDFIVFTQYADYPASLAGWVMIYQISTGIMHSLGAALEMKEPRIHGTNVVWREGNLDAGQIMLYDFRYMGTTREPEIIAGPVPPAYTVAIGSRFVVWSEATAGQLDLVAYDLAAETRIPITATPSVLEMAPVTSGSWIAWEERRNDTLATRIIARNMDTGEERVVADGPAANYGPSIDGDLIAWESALGGRHDIFVHRLSSGETFQVTNDGADHHQSSLLGDKLAFVEERAGTTDICVAHLHFNQAPVAEPQSLTLAEDGTADGRLTATDGDGDSLTFALSAAPQHGTALVSPDGVFTYAPEDSFYGTDSFTFTASDGVLSSAPATVRITITPANTPPETAPTATPSVGVAPLTVEFSAGASDPDGDLLTFAWNFGDGTTSTLENPGHLFVSAGTYLVGLNVSDGRATVSTSLSVTVSSSAGFAVRTAAARIATGGKSRVALWADIGITVPAPADVLTLDFDGARLFALPFSVFRKGLLPRAYTYEKSGLLVRLDFRTSRLFVWTPALSMPTVDNSDGIALRFSAGSATGAENIVMRTLPRQLLVYVRPGLLEPPPGVD